MNLWLTVEAQREKENEQILRREKIVNLFWRKKTFTETRKWQSVNTRPEARKKWHFHYSFLLHRGKNQRIRQKQPRSFRFSRPQEHPALWRLVATKAVELIDFQWEMETAGAVSDSSVSDVTELNLMQISRGCNLILQSRNYQQHRPQTGLSVSVWTHAQIQHSGEH